MKTLEEDVLALLDQIGLLEKAGEDPALAVRSGLDLHPPLRLEHWTAIAVCALASSSTCAPAGWGTARVAAANTTRAPIRR